MLLSASRVLCVLIFVVTPLIGQSTEADLKSRLQGKQLYLRGCWGGTDLNFDGAGNIAGAASKTSFTLCGFELKSLKLDRAGLTLKGKRLGLELRDGKQVVVPVKVDDPKISIAAPPDGDYGPALDAIFTSELASIVPASPNYWDTWGQRSFPLAYIDRLNSVPNESHNDAESRPGSDPIAAKKVGGTVLPPRVLHMEDARFSIAARKLRYSGKTDIKVIVGVDGRIRRVEIVKPLGLGLDEAAVAAVEQYTFAPATQDGNPVPVEVTIEIAFHIY